jgi:hypothetical protein
MAQQPRYRSEANSEDSNGSSFNLFFAPSFIFLMGCSMQHFWAFFQGRKACAWESLVHMDASKSYIKWMSASDEVPA